MPSRDYGSAHRTLAARWRPYAYGKPCCRCGEIMQPGEPLDLDHADDGAGYFNAHPADSFSHARCNRASGARTANRQRGERRATARAVAAQRTPTPKGVIMKMQSTVFGVDIDVDREATFLVGAGRDKNQTVVYELLGHWEGGATAEAVAATLKRFGATPEVVLDPVTAGTLSEPLRRIGVRVRELEPRFVRDALATLKDMSKAEQVKYVPAPVLREAVRRAKIRKLTGRDELDPRAEVPPAPIRAAAFAVAALLNHRATALFIDITGGPADDVEVIRFPGGMYGVVRRDE